MHAVVKTMITEGTKPNIISPNIRTGITVIRTSAPTSVTTSNTTKSMTRNMTMIISAPETISTIMTCVPETTGLHTLSGNTAIITNPCARATTIITSIPVRLHHGQ